jgi:hypothetical protein
MKNQTFQHFMHAGPSAFRFELAGHLNDEGARQLQQDWLAASSVIGDRFLIVDITFVTGVEQEGRALLARWHVEGAQLIAKSKVSLELAEAILGEPLREAESSSPGWTWLPFHAFFGTSKLHLVLLLAMLLFPAQSRAANLTTETVAAWDNYMLSVNATLQDRTRPGGSFLWTFENSERIAKVHGGELIVTPAPGPNPRKVPGGLIHHWIAAAFLPNVNLNDVLEVTQDYDRYKEFYQPTVIASKAVARKASDDYFSILLMNKALFLKTTLDADYQTTNVRLDDRRFYSVTRTTRVQEIEDFGQPGEHRRPEGEGDGYIWKVSGIGRLEQRDGGVYVEIEAIALSREIPPALHLFVDPIVRRVSRNSVLTSLKQTEEAVRRNSIARTTPANSPASAEHTGNPSAVSKNATSAIARVE